MKESRNPKVSVVIDVFRAITTACYVFEKNPKYIYATKTSILENRALNYTNTLFIEKNEISANIEYNVPNSLTRALEIDFTSFCSCTEQKLELKVFKCRRR